jgi:hypothetical protein
MQPARTTPAQRVPVPSDEPLLGGRRYDYADAFTIQVHQRDERSAEQFARYALEHAPRPLQLTVSIAQRKLLRLRLSPSGAPDYLAGWRVVTSEQDVIQLEANSPLLDAMLVGRRAETSGVTLATYVFFTRPVPARLLWKIVSPIHRRVAAYLLERAAVAGDGSKRALTSSQ